MSATLFLAVSDPYKIETVELLWPDPSQPRTQGICSWGAKYPGMAGSRDPRVLRKMAYCLLGLLLTIW